MTELPDLALPATNGNRVNLAKLPGTAVCFIYPYTGKPGIPDPPGWDDIPGAHGSTPQAKAYAVLLPRFQRLAVGLFGLSLQDNGWQKEFVSRAGIGFPLLSDSEGHFSRALSLERFIAGGREFLKRRTLVINDGRIIHDRREIAAPETDAAEVLIWLGEHRL